LPVLTLIIYLHSKTMTRPLTRLSFAAAEIGKGKLDTVIEVKSRDEVGSLANTFNEMAADLKKTTTSIDSLNKEITERKRAEEALAESEEKFRTIIENINVGLYRLAIERNEHGPYGRLILANSALVAILGYESINSLMGINIADHYEGPEDRKFIMEELLRKGIIKNREFRLRKKNGTPLWASVTAKAHYDSQGNIIWVDGIIEDVTERKKMEEKREKLIQELQTAIDNIKTLHGIIPICSSCKKIRDDKGYWHQVEVYISDHSEADFSHGICVECARKLYPEVYKEAGLEKTGK